MAMADKISLTGAEKMRYWLDLFTWGTWNEFLEAGAETSGFRERRWRTVQKIKPGDLLLCYMTGISRFFAILEVTGQPYRDDTPIWSEAVFPCRVPVRMILSLPPEHSVPVIELREHLSYFQGMKSPHSWSGHFRGSPTEEKPRDAQVIIAALEEANQAPVCREYDPRKLKRKVPVFETNAGTVTVPEDTDEQSTPWGGAEIGEEAVVDP